MRRWEEEEKQKRKGGKKQTSEAEYWNLERRLSIAFVYGQGEKTEEDATNDIASSQPRYEIPARSRTSDYISNGSDREMHVDKALPCRALILNPSLLRTVRTSVDVAILIV